MFSKTATQNMIQKKNRHTTMVLADGEGGRGRVGRNHHLPQPLPLGGGVGVVTENEG